MHCCLGKTSSCSIVYLLYHLLLSLRPSIERVGLIILEQVVLIANTIDIKKKALLKKKKDSLKSIISVYILYIE